MDIDHIQPYDALGTPGQTNTQNLAPLGRFTHRVKTHARGIYRKLGVSSRGHAVERARGAGLVPAGGEKPR